MIIPYQQLTEQALTGLLEEFVNRDDDVHFELTLQQKTERVLQQLKSGQAVIVFDASSETTSIISVDQL